MEMLYTKVEPQPAQSALGWRERLDHLIWVVSTTFVLPTYQEEENIIGLLWDLAVEIYRRREQGVLIVAQALIVDDSPDERTIAAVEQVRALIYAQFGPCVQLSVDWIHRGACERDGLAGAMAHGLAAAESSRLDPARGVVVYANTDRQHPEEAMVEMAVMMARDPELQGVFATRYAAGGSAPGFTRTRLAISRGSGLFARLVLRDKLRCVSDPGTGLFAIRRAVVDLAQLDITGWKFALAIMATCLPFKFAELGYEFGSRDKGESKATLSQGLLFIRQVLRLRRTLWLRSTRRRMSAIFAPVLALGLVQWLGRKPMAQFLLTGGGGVIVQLATLHFLLAAQMPVVRATILSIGAAILWNYVLNACWTFRRANGGRFCAFKSFALRAGTAYGQIAAAAWLPAIAYARLHGMLPFSRHLWIWPVTLLAILFATGINWVGTKHWVFSPGLVPFVIRSNLSAPAERAPTPRAPTPVIPAPPPVSAEARAWAQRELQVPPRRRGPLLRSVYVALFFCAVTGICLCVKHDLAVTMDVIIAAYTLPLVITSARSLMRALYINRSPHSADQGRYRISKFGEPQIRFAALVPARKEPILFRNLLRILSLTAYYPRELFRIYPVISDVADDGPTRELAYQAQAQDPEVFETVIAPGSRKKATSLNAVIFGGRLTADWVCVFDAETRPAPRLLQYAAELIRLHPEVGVWQFPVHLMDVHARRRTSRNGKPFRRWNPWGWRWGSWWRGHQCEAYMEWFGSALPQQASKDYISLAGNTNFIRKDLLELVGGYPVTLTEDALLGYKLARLTHKLGLTIRVYPYDALTSQEQTPLTLWKFLMQQVRWLQGFWEVKEARDWLKLPTWRQKLMAWETLSMPAFQAIAGVMVPVALISTFLIKAPMIIVVWAFLPAVLTAWLWLEQAAIFKDFCRAHDIKVGPGYMIRFILTTPAYQLVLSMAAIIGKIRHILGINNWVKTDHAEAEEITPAQKGEDEHGRLAGVAS
jgi:cellulose synthase/poly-beta-1,6-N-acetylglucosamine synthase-like glycosyltransferase/putative flippase GtrA